VTQITSCYTLCTVALICRGSRPPDAPAALLAPRARPAPPGTVVVRNCGRSLTGTPVPEAGMPRRPAPSRLGPAHLPGTV